MQQTVSGILKVLAYFDLFDYPVTKEEISFFGEMNERENAMEDALNGLMSDGRIFRFGNFYSLRNDGGLAERRIRGNEKADRLLATARRISAFLFGFPFVRAIAVSGSLSKNFAGDRADIDYFVITSANRLWIARTIMHLFKKLTFIAGRQHWYCMNYYVDEEALRIKEKNVYTAMEIITLLPMKGNDCIERFFKANEWTAGYFPNSSPRICSGKEKETGLKRIIERIFDNRWGDKADDYLMRVTARRWKKKEEKQQLNIKNNRMGLRAGKHVAKPNPEFFQKALLLAYHNRLKELPAPALKV